MSGKGKREILVMAIRDGVVLHRKVVHTPLEQAVKEAMSKLDNLMKCSTPWMTVVWITVEAEGRKTRHTTKRRFYGLTWGQWNKAVYDYACERRFGKGYVFTAKDGDPAGHGIAAKPTGECSFTVGPKVVIHYSESKHSV